MPLPLRNPLRAPPPSPLSYVSTQPLDAYDYAGWVAEWQRRFPGVVVPSHAGDWSRRDEVLWHMDFYEQVSRCMEPHQQGPKVYSLIIWFQHLTDGQWRAEPEIANHMQVRHGSLEGTPTMEQVGWFEECTLAHLADRAFEFQDPLGPNAKDGRFFWGVGVQIR